MGILDAYMPLDPNGLDERGEYRDRAVLEMSADAPPMQQAMQPQPQPQEQGWFPLSPVGPKPQPQAAPQQSQGLNFDPQLLLKMGAGMGAGRTSLEGFGKTFGAAAEHFDYQNELKENRSRYDDEKKYKADRAAATDKYNEDRLSIQAQKAAKLGSAGWKLSPTGIWTRVNPVTNQVESAGSPEIAEALSMKEDRKDARVQMQVGEKANAALKDPKALEYRQGVDANILKVQGNLKAVGEMQSMIDQKMTPGFFTRLATLAAPEKTKEIHRIIGTDAGKFFAAAERINMDEFLGTIGEFKGSLSNQEGTQIKNTQPKPGDDPALWVEWLGKWGPKMAAHEQALKAHRAELAQMDAQTQAMPTFSNPPATASAPQAPQQNYGRPVTLKPPKQKADPVPVFDSLQAAQAALQAGQIRIGQTISDPSGKQWKVRQPK